MLNIEEFINNNELFDGHYALIRPLSVDGATADVWLALDTNTVTEDVDVSDIARLQEEEIERLGLIVAIKIYRPQNALDIEGEERFRDEYMIVFNCNHTNLIHPTHFSIFKETPYLVLPYCKLGSSELLTGNLTGDEKIWKYIKDVSAGLAYLHALNPPIVHQDIKPANILLDDTGHYAITDFGISSQRGGIHEFYNDEENSGTLAYMAPERFIEGAEPIPASDIWAFGATLFELLTGNVPFGEEGGKKQMEENMTIPDIPGVSSDIQKLIRACLSKEPGDRPSAEKIHKAAEAMQYPIKSKKYIYGLLLALLVVLTALASYFIRPNQKPEPPITKISSEELYVAALKKMNVDDVDSLKAGLNIMDSLSSSGYIPAIYQMAFTYGWYSDSTSVKRKEMLGIKMDVTNKEQQLKCVPTEIINLNKAFGYFNKIVEMKDPRYAKYNADANFRIAWYYYTKTSEKEKAKDYLNQAKYWAEFDNDGNMLKKIKGILEEITK